MRPRLYDLRAKIVMKTDLKTQFNEMER